jgi:hypothetical protein
MVEGGGVNPPLHGYSLCSSGFMRLLGRGNDLSG